MLPCEVAVKSIIPAIRAFIARELIRRYNMRQHDVSRILYITQTAVSHYVRGVRGKIIDLDKIPEVKLEIDRLIKALLSRKITKPFELIREYCKLCTLIRSKKLMCDVHKAKDPQIDGNCDVCLSRTMNCI